MREEKVLKSLVEIGHFSDWFGLSSGYSLRKVADKATLWGYIGGLWSEKALRTVIDPFRDYATKQGLTEKVIDEELQYFAEKTAVDLNQVRRVYHEIEIEPKEKSFKLEELAKEAESEIEAESESEGD